MTGGFLMLQISEQIKSTNSMIGYDIESYEDRIERVRPLVVAVAPPSASAAV